MSKVLVYLQNIHDISFQDLGYIYIECSFWLKHVFKKKYQVTSWAMFESCVKVKQMFYYYELVVGTNNVTGMTWISIVFRTKWGMVIGEWVCAMVHSWCNDNGYHNVDNDTKDDYRRDTVRYHLPQAGRHRALSWALDTWTLNCLIVFKVLPRKFYVCIFMSANKCPGGLGSGISWLL